MVGLIYVVGANVYIEQWIDMLNVFKVKYKYWYVECWI